MEYRRELKKAEVSLGIRHDEASVEAPTPYSNPHYSIFRNTVTQICGNRPFLPPQAVLYARKLAAYKVIKQLLQALLSMKDSGILTLGKQPPNELIVRIQYTLLLLCSEFEKAKCEAGKCIAEASEYASHTKSIGDCFRSSFDSVHSKVGRFPFESMSNSQLETWVSLLTSSCDDFISCLSSGDEKIRIKIDSKTECIKYENVKEFLSYIDIRQRLQCQYASFVMFKELVSCFQKACLTESFKTETMTQIRLKRLLLKAKKNVSLFRPAPTKQTSTNRNKLTH